MRGVRSGWSVKSVGRVGVERRLTGRPSSSDRSSQTRELHPDSEAKNSESVVALRLSQPSRCSQQPLLLLRLSLGNTERETILNLTVTTGPNLPTVGRSHLLLGMTVRQSPVWASQTRICPARQQLASSIPSLAKHSMSCRTGSKEVRQHPGQFVNVFPWAVGPHHAVAPQQQRGDLTDGWRVAVVITGEVPSPPSAMSRSVLAVVPWAENPVKTEKQQNQQDARSQAQSRHPGWEGTRQQSIKCQLFCGRWHASISTTSVYVSKQ